MYEALIQDLRDKTEFLLKANRDSSIHNSFAETMNEAANAIEELDYKYQKALSDLVKQAEPPKEKT